MTRTGEHDGPIRVGVIARYIYWVRINPENVHDQYKLYMAYARCPKASLSVDVFRYRFIYSDIGTFLRIAQTSDILFLAEPRK